MKKTNVQKQLENVVKSLKILGFKKEQINFALKKVKPQKSAEETVEQAIKTIALSGQKEDGEEEKKLKSVKEKRRSNDKNTKTI